MEVEDHAQRKQLRGAVIQALTSAFSFKPDESQALRDHKKNLRDSLLSPQGTSMISQLFLLKQEEMPQGNRQGAPYLFDSVIQH
jgi:hypothetical protein